MRNFAVCRRPRHNQHFREMLPAWPPHSLSLPCVQSRLSNLMSHAALAHANKARTPLSSSRSWHNSVPVSISTHQVGVPPQHLAYLATHNCEPARDGASIVITLYPVVLHNFACLLLPLRLTRLSRPAAPHRGSTCATFSSTTAAGPRSTTTSSCRGHSSCACAGTRCSWGRSWMPCHSTCSSKRYCMHNR